MTPKPLIRRLGTLDFGVCETTPVVFRRRLYRFEHINRKYHKSCIPDSYFRFVDVTTGDHTPGFALNHHLGSAHAEGDTMYGYGLPGDWGSDTIQVFWSRDLKNWSSQTALRIPHWRLYNNSVCKGPDRYVMAFEVGAPNEVVGVPFTNFFAVSDDLLHWRFLGEDCVFTKDRYSAAPTLRYHDPYYYLLYLERHGPAGETDCDKLLFDTYIARTQDFHAWESSPLNPFMTVSEDDRRRLNSGIGPEQRQRIARAPMMNVSDVDLCEHEGEVVIYFSWGSQKGIEYLAEARFDGPFGELLEGFFP
jgi:hypothetical protein